ncbi:MAG: agmatinase [Bdellovibrionaceae bacterium]|nr:agmatinase [Pseudobdellovibrionaceae bacterium]
MSLDVSDVGLKNGNYLGLDIEAKDADIVVFPIPWDVTTSYRPGTVDGPDSVLNASTQLDLYSPYLDDVGSLKIGTIPVPEQWRERSASLRKQTAQYISALEQGEDRGTAEMTKIREAANRGGVELQEWSRKEVAKLLDQGQAVLTLGGDHSVPLGPIEAHAAKFPGLSVLHFDAHADLRDAYEGFEQSHASIMFNVLKLKGVDRLVQVGIRDVSEFEINLIKNDDRIHTFFDWDLKNAEYEGESWKSICDRIVAKLGPQVYISFDIDGLDPKLCPNTGTPVPGGLEMAQATALIQAVVRSGRKVVGGDLVEVAPAPEGDEWDGNVGARMLFQIMIAVAQGRR